MLEPGNGEPSLEREGYQVLRGAVGAYCTQAALRLVNLSIRRLGLTAEQIAECQGTTFFPHLRWEADLWAVLPPPAARLLGWQDGDDWAEPQILLRFPDENEYYPLKPHVDEPPPWAQKLGYRGIVGVALTEAGARDGAPCVWPGSHRDRPSGPEPVPLHAGDALLMHPKLAHAGTVNLGPSVRVAVYFRLVAGARRVSGWRAQSTGA